MKRIILSLLLILNSCFLFSTDYSRIDKQAMTVPPNVKTAGDIARYVTRHLASPADKARAIYCWIAHNITYDVSHMYTTETYTDPQELVDKVLKTRRGVCSNYAALFQACCRSVGVQSYIIEGYTRQNDKTISIGHAWNAVKIDDRYYNIDCTWASGYLRGNSYTWQFRDIYFLIPPVEFIKSHMPFDPVWQFLTNPITHKEFDNGDFSGLKKESNFNFADSINIQSGLNTLEKLIRENQRIIHAGQTNLLIRNHVRNNQQGIDTEKYNQAAEAFNKGVEVYNGYIRYKNTQFQKLTMSDNKILELLSTSRRLVESAYQTVSSLNSDNYELRNSTGSLEKSIRYILKGLDNEDKFIDKYIRTARPMRMNLFYRENR
ncbi:MAG: transglutaminase domain-containing protein [Paludibacter sp.]|nr:transglutaminase domain-containing protein [Paludibacter sp.]